MDLIITVMLFLTLCGAIGTCSFIAGAVVALVYVSHPALSKASSLPLVESTGSPRQTTPGEREPRARAGGDLRAELAAAAPDLPEWLRRVPAGPRATPPPSTAVSAACSFCARVRAFFTRTA